MITPVILSGGVGSRLWPVSREGRPKQFLPIGGALSMLQQTQLRLAGIETAPAIVVCNEVHRFMVAEQFREIGEKPGAIILEPAGRNTAPAIALAAQQAIDGDPDALLLVLPADHHIAAPDAFLAAVEQGLGAAAAGCLVTFGVVPTGPETGYGYIRGGSEAAPGVLKLDRFVEKPDVKTAQGYLAEGDYYWNSGMFLLRARTYLELLAQQQPAMYLSLIHI